MGRWRRQTIKPRILELIGKGVDPIAIAERLGTTRSQVYEIMHGEGIYQTSEDWRLRRRLTIERNKRFSKIEKV